MRFRSSEACWVRSLTPPPLKNQNKHQVLPRRDHLPPLPRGALLPLRAHCGGHGLCAAVGHQPLQAGLPGCVFLFIFFVGGFVLLWGIPCACFFVSVVCVILCVSGWDFDFWGIPHTHTTSIHQTVWDAFCNSWLFKLWRAYFHYEWLLEEKVLFVCIKIQPCVMCTSV